jgi:hypothetical protein
MAKVPELTEGPSSAIEPSHPATAEARVELAEEPIPKTVERGAKNYHEFIKRSITVEGSKGCCNNSKEKENG